MQELDDNILLTQYAEGKSEEAFAALVSRHINKVYSVALRHTRNPSQAEEITQAVFFILAKKPESLGRRVILSGWLYQTARLASLTFLKSELRRARREQEAHMQSILNEPADETWKEIAPLLDSAMAALNKTDRHAVVLRFFDGKSMREVGATLGATEDTAKKRVGRALEKLRKYFAKRGVHSTTVIIAGAISSNSVKIAPPALAQTVIAAAIAKDSAAAASTASLVKGILKVMTLQKIKIAGVAIALMLLAAGTTALAARDKSDHSSSIPYRMADDFWLLLNSVNTNRLQIQLTLHPQDICLTIHSSVKGPVTFRPDTNGLLTAFPHDEVLRRENPAITADTANASITVWCSLSVPNDLTFDYSRLSDGADEASQTIAKAYKIVSPENIGWFYYIEWLFTPSLKVKGIVLGFKPSIERRATLKIAAVSGTKTYRADAKGIIILKLDNTLLSQDPQVTISEKPLFISPDISY